MMISKKELRFALFSILALIIIFSTYFLVFSGSPEEDNIPPTLSVISKDFSKMPGEIATININFSDNDQVTKATLHYRLFSEETWNQTSILNKTYSWRIPATVTENYAYFVTVNDGAGNGPVGDPSINGSIYYTIFILDNDTNDNTKNNTRYVFIEESTHSSCAYCPEVAQHLQSLSESNKYPFYYVSMIQNNQNANDRLLNDFNLYGNPTVYIDGGYRVIKGAKDKNAYEDAIRTALSRDTADIAVSIVAEKKNTSNDATLVLTVTNNENNQYTGTVKLYLTEIVSSTWSDYNGDRYHNAFLSFLMDEQIQISAQSEKTFTKTVDVSFYEDPENLRVYAVVFNSEKHQQYSNPPDEYPFDAYYVDGADAVTIIEGGNLPPSVGFITPKNNKIQFFNRILFSSITFKNTILIGRTTISIQASDPEGEQIQKVELYLDNELVKEFTEKPYEWTLTGPSVFRFRHTLKAIAYDESGKTATDEKQIIAFILF